MVYIRSDISVNPFPLHAASPQCLSDVLKLKRVSVQGRHLARAPFLPVIPSKIELYRADAGGGINVKRLGSYHHGSEALFFLMKYFYLYSTRRFQTHAPRTAHTQEEMNQHVLGDCPHVLNRAFKLFQKTIFLYHTFDISAHVCIFKHYSLCSSNPSCIIVEINAVNVLRVFFFLSRSGLKCKHHVSFCCSYNIVCYSLF